MLQQSIAERLRGLMATRNTFYAAGMIAASPPWWRRRGVIIGAVVVLLIIVLGAILIPILLNRRSGVNYNFQPVMTGDLSVTVSATGPLQSAIYNLVFTGTGGKISAIDVKVGQSVVKGQVLAQLDKTSLQDAYNQQQAVVQAAQQSLADAQNNLANQQSLGGANFSSAQTTLSNDQAALNTTKSQQQATIAENQQTLTSDQTALNNTRAQQQATIAQAQQTLNGDQTALNNTRATSQASVNAAQTTLNSDQTALNNAQTVANAQIQTALATEQQALANCSLTPTPTSSSNCRQIAINTYNQAVAQANQSVAMARAKVTADQSALNTAQATANANNAQAQAKVTADQSALNTAQATANTTIGQAQAKVAADQKALLTAQANANTAIQQAQAKIAADQKALTTTNASSTLNNGTSQITVTTDQANLRNAQLLLAADQHNLDNATLTAPHNGVISVINGSVGGSPGVPINGSSGTTSATGASTFIQLIDSSTLQVVANVNETDTANVKPGEPVQFTVNAYGNQQFQGTVDSISPNGQTTSNVVTYPVYIDIDTNSLKGATLLSNMTANVTITTVQHTGVIVIPVNAVNFARLASSGSTTANVPQAITPQQANAALSQARQMINTLQNQQEILAQGPMPAFVLERVNNQIIAKPVVLGLTDGTQYEVLDGLTTNDVIIVGVASPGQRTAPGGAGNTSGAIKD